MRPDHDPAPASDSGSDPVEALLAGVVALPAAEQPAAVAHLVAQHPELAAELQARYAAYQRLCALVPEPAPCHPANHAVGLAPAQRFGEYELVRELGRGGMGIVYLARQRRGAQERLVALKLVRDRGAFSSNARERLRREGAAAFRLDHPGICAVYDTGEVEGTPFLAMRYVPGRTLAEHIAAAAAARGPLVLPKDTATEGAESASTSSVVGRMRSVVALVEQVARALHVAHEAGFVHRDVKPGNVMVTPDGQPVLLDFGLVRDEGRQEDLTLTGQALGTPAYMSPEQIEPKGRAIDRTTDVYSLGVTLYEALALQKPFEGRTREALFHDILTRRAADLRQHAPFVSRDLRIVVGTAMDPDPRRRYATALDFAEDLRRVRLAQPIVARPASVARRLQLWCQRNPLAAVVLVLLLVAVVAVVGLAVGAQRRAAEAEVARQQAQADFRAAREAVGELTTMARLHLTDVPWLEPVRRDLFARALAFHREFLARAEPGAGLALDRAITQVQCAALIAQLGDAGDAKAMLEEACRDLERGLGGDLEATGWLARAQLLLAQMAEDRGDGAAAEPCFRRAIDLLQQLAAARPLTVAEAVTLSQALRNLATSHEERNRGALARELVAAAMAVVPRAADPGFDLERARVLGQRARQRREDRDGDGALADLRSAEAMLRPLLAARPQDREAMSVLAVNRLSLGVLLSTAGKVSEAKDAYAEGRTLFERLVAAFPHVLAYRSNLATLLGNLSALRDRTGESTGSREEQRRAIELHEGILRDNPSSTDSAERLAHARYRLAQAVRREDPDEAAEAYQRALEGVDALLQRKPDDRSARDLGWRAANSLGTLEAGRSRDEAARAAFARARHHGEALLAFDPADLRWLRNQSLLLFNEGTHAAELGDLPAAIARLREGLALDARLVAGAAAGDDQVRAHLERCRHQLRLAQVLELGDPAAAAAAWDEGATLLDAAPEPVRQRRAIDAEARFTAACLERGHAASQIDRGELVAGAAALERMAQWLAGLDDNLAMQVELLLRDLARRQWATQVGDSEVAAAAVAALQQRVPELVRSVGTSRLHSQRLARVLPRLRECLEAATADSLQAALRLPR